MRTNLHISDHSVQHSHLVRTSTLPKHRKIIYCKILNLKISLINIHFTKLKCLVTKNYNICLVDKMGGLGSLKPNNILMKITQMFFKDVLLI